MSVCRVEREAKPYPNQPIKSHVISLVSKLDLLSFPIDAYIKDIQYHKELIDEHNETKRCWNSGSGADCMLKR